MFIFKIIINCILQLSSHTVQQTHSSANSSHSMPYVPQTSSPSSMPSTSKQALRQQIQIQQQMQLLKQQQQHQAQLQQQQQAVSSHHPPRTAPSESFFLFRQQNLREQSTSDGHDHFSDLSDEIILQIFKWLPKKTLIRCGYVCRRFNRCASDESLWTRLDLGSRAIKAGAMENILHRGVVILRLAQAEVSLT